MKRRMREPSWREMAYRWLEGGGEGQREEVINWRGGKREERGRGGGSKRKRRWRRRGPH